MTHFGWNFPILQVFRSLSFQIFLSYLEVGVNSRHIINYATFLHFYLWLMDGLLTFLPTICWSLLTCRWNSSDVCRINLDVRSRSPWCKIELSEFFSRVLLSSPNHPQADDIHSLLRLLWKAILDFFEFFYFDQSDTKKLKCNLGYLYPTGCGKERKLL